MIVLIIEPLIVRVFFTRTGIHFARKRYGTGVAIAPS